MPWTRKRQQDTGWQDVILPDYLAAGTLKVRRTAAGVHLKLIGAKGISGKTTWTGAIPTGFRPSRWEFARTVPIWSGEQDASVRLESDGTIRFTFANQDMAAPLNLTVFYACDQPWPTGGA